jgi:hypothetical protein
MPVWRFRSLEDARRAQWVDPRDPSLPDRIRSLFALARRLAPPCHPRGLLKFTSIEEANAERLARERRRAREIREKNLRP